MKNIYKKSIVISIILLLVGFSVSSAISGDTISTTSKNKIKELQNCSEVSKSDLIIVVRLLNKVEFYSRINNSFLNYSKGAAEWLMNEAILVGDGYKWPDSAGGNYYYTDLYDGSPGIVTLFSKLYEMIADEEYFQFAVGGAQWLIERAIPEAGGYKWPQREGLSSYYTGLYVGTAGTGDAFINLYETLSDTIYLDYAIGAANWLLNAAIFENQDECKWPSSQYAADYCTDIIYGAAGIGLFLLRMYDLTNNPEYLNYSRYAGNWLVNQAIPVSSGYKWAVSNYCPYIYTGFSHGAAGIGYFLAELFAHTNDSIYLEYAEGAGQWLIDIAVPEAGGCKWWSKDGATPSYATGWCHGPAGTCLLFMKLYQITSNNIYLNYAKMGSTWLISLAIPSGGGYKWPHYQGSPANDITICHGAAGIGDFFLKMFDLTNEVIYYDYAEGAAEWLKSVADTSAGGYRWASFGSYYTGFSTGTSGVGLFFLDMYEPPEEPDEPDLVCFDKLKWVDVKPDSTVTGSFQVGNIGDPDSLLDWEIIECPDWGIWSFNPDSGNDLLAGETVDITVEIVAPNEGEKVFTGEVTLVNSEDSNDTCNIDVSLTTPRIRATISSCWLRFIKMIPILLRLLNYNFQLKS
jgi:rhamnogalacturonyl hydrolase YesR